MTLTSVQEDALAELLDIGFGRAATLLSQLTGHRVLLAAPSLSLRAIEDVSETLERVVHGHVASVHQIFCGPVGGEALLILDAPGASMLKELLTGESALPLSIDASAREVITEVGNVLLNASLGAFGDLLNMRVSFSVPHLEIGNVAAILQSRIVARQGLRHALIVHAGFRLRDGAVTAYLIIVLSVASLDRLMHAVDAWEAAHR
jgi:chemotaxis protein CheC